jgi:hypothetical protein
MTVIEIRHHRWGWKCIWESARAATGAVQAVGRGLEVGADRVVGVGLGE